MQSRDEGRLVIDSLLDEADADQGMSAKQPGKEVALVTAGTFLACRDYPRRIDDAPAYAAKPPTNALARRRDGRHRPLPSTRRFTSSLVYSHT